MSNLFNDTTRLRLHSRPSLTNIFNSHEAPVLTRPKEPPPPPPPVEQVLLPVTPPRKFFPLFTSDELKRINSVINGKTSSDDTETIDEFSSDEFSDDDEFQNTYENLNVYDSVPDLAMEEDSLEEKMSFGPEYGESPLPMTSTPFKTLVEKASEKTIIFTSSPSQFQSLKEEILISSSSWINLQVKYFSTKMFNDDQCVF